MWFVPVFVSYTRMLTYPHIVTGKFIWVTMRQKPPVVRHLVGAAEWDIATSSFEPAQGIVSVSRDRRNARLFMHVCVPRSNTRRLAHETQTRITLELRDSARDLLARLWPQWPQALQERVLALRAQSEAQDEQSESVRQKLGGLLMRRESTAMVVATREPAAPVCVLNAFD
jgi:hypothetical protein